MSDVEEAAKEFAEAMYPHLKGEILRSRDLSAKLMGALSAWSAKWHRPMFTIEDFLANVESILNDKAGKDNDLSPAEADKLARLSIAAFNMGMNYTRQEAALRERVKP